jgi:hypothetical protein
MRGHVTPAVGACRIAGTRLHCSCWGCRGATLRLTAAFCSLRGRLSPDQPAQVVLWGSVGQEPTASGARGVAALLGGAAVACSTTPEDKEGVQLCDALLAGLSGSLVFCREVANPFHCFETLAKFAVAVQGWFSISSPVNNGW